MRQGNEFLRLTSTTDSRKLPDFPKNDAPWVEQAKCAALTPQEADNLFFVPFGRTSKEAKEFCAKCPVKQECSQYALSNRDLQGVWAGLSEKERQRMAAMLSVEIPVKKTIVNDSSITSNGNSSEFVSEVVVVNHFGSVGTNNQGLSST